MCSENLRQVAISVKLLILILMISTVFVLSSPTPFETVACLVKCNVKFVHSTSHYEDS